MIDETIQLLRSIYTSHSRNFENNKIQRIKRNISQINRKVPFLTELLKQPIYRDLYTKFINIYKSFPITCIYNQPDEEGKTTLMYLIERNYRKMVLKFIKSDAININIADNKGNTALTYAIKNNSSEIIFGLVYEDMDITPIL